MAKLRCGVSSMYIPSLTYSLGSLLFFDDPVGLIETKLRPKQRRSDIMD